LKVLTFLCLSQGKELQTGFTTGMESILGVHNTPALSAAQELGADAVEADRQDQDETKGQLRDRYVRSFWEPVAEGTVGGDFLSAPNLRLKISQEPIMPGVLQHARRTAEKHVRASEDAKSNPNVLGQHKGNPPRVQSLPSGITPGRPMIEFVDVGGKFIDLKEHTARAKESARRRTVKDKKKVQTS
jgi:hypothetical protein